MSEKFKNHYDRVFAGQKIVTKMFNDGFTDDEIIKAVFEETQLGKRWTLNYLSMIK